MKPSSSPLNRKALSRASTDKPFQPLSQCSSPHPGKAMTTMNSIHEKMITLSCSKPSKIQPTTHMPLDSPELPVRLYSKEDYTFSSLLLSPNDAIVNSPNSLSLGGTCSPLIFPTASNLDDQVNQWLPSVSELLDERFDLNATRITTTTTTSTIMDQGDACRDFAQLLERRGIDSPNKENRAFKNHDGASPRKTTRMVVPFPTTSSSSTSTTSNMCQSLPNLYSQYSASSYGIPTVMVQAFFNRMNLLDSQHPSNSQQGSSISAHAQQYLNSNRTTWNGHNMLRPRVSPQRCLTPEPNRPSSPPSVKRQYRKVKREMSTMKTIVPPTLSSPRGITKTSSRNDSRRILVNRVAQLFQNPDEEDAL
ncbi:hypothetical protein C9374_003948 [Naegleria lovaniensis]|uniref:Uncharacterized protein n=1 Tax=Naegleria lovaniensis TaxID=51637 RepID=A0AA88H0X9_NAELO|nr:uncharacterized protein C9374_003948 [Naegleria lovaniensis]KAG2394184.1 hypothetical protein C9374_003948 [Naegleria lovaniensis]